MSILLLIRSLDHGGAQRQLVALAQGLHQRGHSITVAVFYAGGSLISELAAAGVRVVTLDKRSRWDAVAFLVRLVRLIRTLKPDVVYAFLVEPSIVAVAVKPLARGARVVWGVRASNMNLRSYGWFPRLTFRGSRWLARFANLIIANSAAGARFHQDEGYPATKMAVVVNGIDVDRFRPDQVGRQRLRAAWRLRDDQTAIGIVARLDPMKDHAIFLEAAAIISQERPEAQFVCVGDGPELLATQLRARAHELGIGDRVIWTGLMTDMPAVYGALDLVCSTSAYGEGHSNMLGEAMACGVPCVATNVGDAASIVDRCGIVVPPRNPLLLAAAVGKMLGKADADLRQACRARIEQSFSVGRMVQETERLLRECVRGSA